MQKDIEKQEYRIKLKQAFIELIQIKKIIALILTIGFVVLTFLGEISGEQFMTVFGMVVSFYFGQSSVRQTIAENRNPANAPGNGQNGAANNTP